MYDDFCDLFLALQMAPIYVYLELEETVCQVGISIPVEISESPGTCSVGEMQFLLQPVHCCSYN